MDDGRAPAPSFAELLRRYRQRAGLSQADLAERAGVTVSAISALERGARTRPYPYTTRQLAVALGLDGQERAAFLAVVPRTATTQPAAPAEEPERTLSASIPAAPPTPLIGRSLDLASLRARIDRPATGRLTTITGLGGIGKTRLALQLVAEVGTTFPDGVWFVALAPVDDPAEVTRAVAAELGVREIPGVPLVERLVAFLAPRRALLVLDNCEHVHEACAALLGRLLAGCPDIQAIATSREPFHIAGEQVWRLGPLAVPEDGAASPEQLMEAASVRLFVERAQAVAAHFRLTDENAAAVADICTRLEGIPLAIELAAAWVRVLKVEQIAARLSDVLASGRRGTPGRQQTLRATLDWSYTLLDEPEQRLFERLAVFRGGCDLETAETVCASDDLPTSTVLALLAQLVDQSLVQVEDDGPVARYRLLEPVRHYAAERLAMAGEAEAVAARHASAFLALAERAAPELCGPGQIACFQRLDRDQDNFRVALHWLAGQGNAPDGLRLAVALAPFWSGRGHLSEGRRWLATMLALPGADATPPELRVLALLRSGELAQWQADLGGATATLESCISLARATGDERCESEALVWLGATRRNRGDRAEAIETLDQALALARRIDDRPVTAFALLNLGVTAVNDGDFVYGRSLLDESLKLYRSLGNPRFIAITSTMLGEVVRFLDERTRAATLLREGLAGHLAVGDRAFIVVSLRQIAAIVAGDRPESAARLLGAAEALRETIGASATPITRAVDDETMDTLRMQLPADSLDRALAEGRAMTVEQASDEALATVDILVGAPDRIPQP